MLSTRKKKNSKAPYQVSCYCELHSTWQSLPACPSTRVNRPAMSSLRAMGKFKKIPLETTLPEMVRPGEKSSMECNERTKESTQGQRSDAASGFAMITEAMQYILTRPSFLALSGITIVLLVVLWNLGETRQATAFTREFIFTETTAPAASSHASTVVETPQRSLLVAWFGGSSEGAADVAIWSARKEVGESGWSAPRQVAKVSDEAHWNPVLFYTSDSERLWLHFKAAQGGPHPSSAHSEGAGEAHHTLPAHMTAQGGLHPHLPRT
ncbi:hypothetical protein CYMTET_11491 [Cymbomonas tetramitiformis]|uniref:Sialidase domain-containing protein n=1 Tax=Cymbomonas tetramitiformis TaxID=36881 RepID=A0AAE0LDF1_9CHLO|nr:hypothetical protein CYMTET_11491 [Cymbomonas tetramitiformis]